MDSTPTPWPQQPPPPPRIHGGWSPKMWHVYSLFCCFFAAIFLHYAFKLCHTHARKKRASDGDLDASSASSVVLKKVKPTTPGESSTTLSTRATSFSSLYGSLNPDPQGAATMPTKKKKTGDDDLSRLTRLLREGSFEDAVHFLDHLADVEGDRSLERLAFGRRRQRLVHVVAEVGTVQFMEHLIARERGGEESGGRGKTSMVEHEDGSRTKLWPPLTPPSSSPLLEAKDAEGCTPLAYATCRGRRGMTKKLIQLGANLEASDYFGNGVLLHAATSRDPDLVAVFLEEAGKEVGRKERLVNRQNERGCTALHFAVAEGDLETAKLLSEHGADPYLRQFPGITVLHAAATMGLMESFKWLVGEMSMSLLTLTNAGDTPLHFAAGGDQVEIVAFCLDQYQFRIDSRAISRELPKNEEGMTPLDVAAKQNSVNSARYIVEKLEAKAQMRYWEKMQFPLRALFLACEHGHVHVVEILLSASTLRKDNNILGRRDDGGRNCLMVALEMGHEHVVDALVNDHEWSHAMYIQDAEKNTPMRELISQFPDQALTVFSKCLTECPHHDDVDSLDYAVIFNFDLIEDAFLDLRKPRQVAVASGAGEVRDLSASIRAIHSDESKETTFAYEFKKKEEQEDEEEDDDNNRDDESFSPMGWIDIRNDPLMMMVRLKRDELFRHPLVVGLLRVRGPLLYTLDATKLAFACSFAFAISMIMTTQGRSNDVACGANLTTEKFCGFLNADANVNPNPNAIDAGCLKNLKVDPKQSAYFVAVFVLVCVGYFITFLQIATNGFMCFGKRFALDLVSYTGGVLITVDTDLCRKDEELISRITAHHFHVMADWQYTLGCICLLISWVNFIVKMMDLKYVGTFIIMIAEVSKTFLKFTVVLVPLIAIFGLVFYAMLHAASHSRFQSGGYSMLKTFIMTLGEIEFGDFIEAVMGSQLSTLDSHLVLSIFIAFLIIMPVIVMNLLLGLAVGDIENIRHKAGTNDLKTKALASLSIQYQLPLFLQYKIQAWMADIQLTRNVRFQSSVAIWTPNDTFANRLRQKYGFAINARTAHEMRELLIEFTPEKKRVVEKEIELRTTGERIKQMHENIEKMARDLEEIKTEAKTRKNF